MSSPVLELRVESPLRADTPCVPCFHLYGRERHATHAIHADELVGSEFVFRFVRYTCGDCLDEEMARLRMYGQDSYRASTGGETQ